MTEQPFFAGKPTTFEEAFPEIEEIEIRGTEGSLGSADKIEFSLNKDNINHFPSCSNRLCKNGGYLYKFNNLIAEMYHKKETSKEKLIVCKGHENMGRGQTRTCCNSINLKIKIKYK